eukprot:3634785-Rhodomonas_salina.2
MELASANLRMGALEAEVEKLKLALQDKSAEAARLSDENTELLTEKTRLSSVLKATKQVYDGLNAKNNRLVRILSSENTELKEENKDLLKRIEDVRAQNKSLFDQHYAEWNENNTLKDEVGALRAENDRLRAEITPTVVRHEEVHRRVLQRLETLRAENDSLRAENNSVPLS